MSPSIMLHEVLLKLLIMKSAKLLTSLPKLFVTDVPGIFVLTCFVGIDVMMVVNLVRTELKD